MTISLLVPGCFDMHGRERLTPELGPDAAPSDGGLLRPDSFVPGLDAAPRPDVMEPDFCAAYLDRIARGEAPESIGCDGRTFPRDCGRPVGECCFAQLDCAVEPTDGGHVTVTLSCDDSCDQGCAAQAPADCGFFPYCEWFAPGACTEPPAGIIGGPACIERRGDFCDSDVDCPPSTLCQSYWIDPCAGERCSACAGEERRCGR